MATANGCGNAVDIQPATASGVNSTAVSSPVVFNYPKSEPDDSGRMMALASIIGGLFDALLGGDGLSEAEAAQTSWKAIVDDMKARGLTEMDRVPTERAKLATFESDLSAQLTDYRAKADLMWPKLDVLDAKMQAEIDEQRTKSNNEFDFSNVTCLDDAIDKLCEYVGCGYTPDYLGISTRAQADANIKTQKAYAEACRVGNRYNTRRTTSALLDIRLATSSAAILASSVGREKERQYAFDTNLKMRYDHAAFLEKTRMGRRELSIKYDEMAMRTMTERWQSFAKIYLDLEHDADRLSMDRWKAYMESAFKSFELGGSAYAAAAQAYQTLAASIRATSKQSGGGGGVAGLLAQLTAIATIFSGKCSDGLFGIRGRPESCCGAATTPAASTTPTCSQATTEAECTSAGGTWVNGACECAN